MRVLLSAALLLVTASCAYLPPAAQWSWTASLTPKPGRLALSNYRFDHAAVETMVTTAPDCAAADPSAAQPADFDLPFKGTRVIVAEPNADVCWRRQLASGQWTDWNRAFTGTGRYIDTQL